MKRIYLDHTATTPLHPVVRDAMLPYFSETYGNASSVHWFGRQAKTALESARHTIASAIGADPAELFFTSGGTESDNFAVRGALAAAAQQNRRGVVTSAAEHHAVLECCEEVHGRNGDVHILPVTTTGAVTPEAVREACTASTALVTIMHSNNEVGTLSPITDIAACAHERGALLHTDAVQSLGKVPLEVKRLGVDLMTMSAHKLYGPKGIGALFIRRGTDIEPLLRGGGQERGKRPGTENVALAVGFAEAVRLAVADLAAESARLRDLRDGLQRELTGIFDAIMVNGHPTERLPHILNVSFDSRKLPMEGEMLLVALDLHGIAVSSGSACTSGSIQPSHVLLAMGRDPATAKATIRFSFGRQNTPEDVHAVVEAMKRIVGPRA